MIAYVTATDDADETVQISHNMGAPPSRFGLVGITLIWITSAWYINGWTDYNIQLKKLPAVGSGHVVPQVYVWADLPGLMAV